MRCEGLIGTITRAFERFGAAVTVEHGGERRETRGFLQPVARTEGEPFYMGSAGALSTRCWRYLGCADTPVEQGDYLICAGKRYRVRHAEKVGIGERVTHYRAVVDREEDAT